MTYSWKFSIKRKWTDLNFLHLLKNLPSLFKKSPSDLDTDNLWILWHTTPQSRYLINNAGEAIVDFIGRIESIDDHIALLDDYLGVSRVKGEIGRRGDSSRPFKETYLKYYCDESRRLVEEIYCDDLNLLGYSFGEKEPTNVFRDIKLKKLSELSALSSA